MDVLKAVEIYTRGHWLTLAQKLTRVQASFISLCTCAGSRFLNYKMQYLNSLLYKSWTDVFGFTYRVFASQAERASNSS